MFVPLRMVHCWVYRISGICPAVINRVNGKFTIELLDDFPSWKPLLSRGITQKEINYQGLWGNLIILYHMDHSLVGCVFVHVLVFNHRNGMMIPNQDTGIKIDCHIKKRDRVDLVPKRGVENKS